MFVFVFVLVCMFVLVFVSPSLELRGLDLGLGADLAFDRAFELGLVLVATNRHPANRYLRV